MQKVTMDSALYYPVVPHENSTPVDGMHSKPSTQNRLGPFMWDEMANVQSTRLFNPHTREVANEPLEFNESIRILQLMAGAHMFADQIELAHHYDAILFHGTGLGHLPIEDPNGDSPENEAMREALEEVLFKRVLQ